MSYRILHIHTPFSTPQPANPSPLTDHLSKPPLTHPSSPPSPAYVAALKSLSADPHVYMKLSGPFNEFPSQPTPSSVDEIIEALTPVLDVVLKCFPDRVMFGSDWPVCNVGGPQGEQGNWGLWRDVVAEVGRRWELDMEGVWGWVGAEAYGVEM
jgi:L-rhamnono-1,4-lactonase